MPKKYIEVPLGPRTEGVGAQSASSETVFIESVRETAKEHHETQAELVLSTYLIATGLKQHSAGTLRALLMAQSKTARKSASMLREAGFIVVLPQAGDWRLDVNPKIGDETVTLGQKPTKALLYNAFAVLQAAQDAQVNAIFLDGVSESLAQDNRFLVRANEAGIRVFIPLPEDLTRLYWTECEPMVSVQRTTPSDTQNDPSEAHPSQADGQGTASSTCDEACTVPQPTRWRRCHACGMTFDDEEYLTREYHCPSCGTLNRLGAQDRIDLILDDGIMQEWDTDLADADPLQFPGYAEKIDAQRSKTGLHEGVRTGSGCIGRVPVAFGVMDCGFFMGSMGSYVGEKIARLFDRATEQGLPVVLFCTSGGARMQEGLASLMQMAKVSCAIERHSNAGLLYISVITDPTTGGVTASFATLGDIILAEPKALIGFAGQRVIRDTIKQELPEGFQTAEFALAHGLIDTIVERVNMRRVLKTLLRLHCWDHGRPDVADSEPLVTAESYKPLSEKDRKKLERHARRALRSSGIPTAVEAGSAWERVQLARNVHRPTSLAYIEAITESFVELHGDRAFSDDEAIVGGIGIVAGQSVTIIAQEKGSDLNNRIRRNFGCPLPEGYRKSARLMKQAEKFGRPIICLVDTQGAFCGMEAEERGAGNAIAENLKLMAGLKVPVISVLLGEGGSGGALALAVSNKVAMQENAVYSILSPEGFASILWKDGKRAPEAAEVMKMDAAHVYELGYVDEILSEGPGPAHENPAEAYENVLAYLEDALAELEALSSEELVVQRQARFAKF